MAQQKTFRTAFNGFNREDVVHYLEYLNAKHTSERNQLISELEFVKNKLAEAQRVPVQDPQLPARCAELEAKLAQAEADREAALAEKEYAIQERDAALASQAAAQSQSQQELEAYRRAERAERLAKERAEKVYHQVNGVLADATVKVDGAFSQIGALSDQVMAQLSQLNAAVDGSKQALQDAAEMMYALRPTADEE